MSHIRPAVEGVTASAAARSAIRCGPPEASTTSARGDLRQPDDERCAQAGSRGHPRTQQPAATTAASAEDATGDFSRNLTVSGPLL
jgi:hypothetical protein